MHGGHSTRGCRGQPRGFTLVELVMVVTILSVIAAIAVPRMTRASASANALQATLTAVRTGIDLYYAEHGRFPGYDPSNGSTSGEHFVEQLTLYTDRTGNANTTYAGAFVHGPYVRAPFPQNPMNSLATVHVKATPGAADPAEGSVGWVAVLSTGDFGVSASDSDLDEIGIINPNVQDEVRPRATAL